MNGKKTPPFSDRNFHVKTPPTSGSEWSIQCQLRFLGGDSKKYGAKVNGVFNLNPMEICLE